MKARLVLMLRALLEWLEPPAVDPRWETVRALVEWADRLDATGEYKRHQVYARLKKTFPGGRGLGLLLEQVVAARRKKR